MFLWTLKSGGLTSLYTFDQGYHLQYVDTDIIRNPSRIVATQNHFVLLELFTKLCSYHSESIKSIRALQIFNGRDANTARLNGAASASGSPLNRSGCC